MPQAGGGAEARPEDFTEEAKTESLRPVFFAPHFGQAGRRAVEERTSSSNSWPQASQANS